MQHLENRAANGVIARHALHSRLAFAIPDVNAVVTVDHIQARRKRVHHPFDKPALLSHFSHPCNDFRLQYACVQCACNGTRKHIRDHSQNGLQRGTRRCRQL